MSMKLRLAVAALRHSVTTRDTIDESWRQFKTMWRWQERNIYKCSSPKCPAEEELWQP